MEAIVALANLAENPETHEGESLPAHRPATALLAIARGPALGPTV